MSARSLNMTLHTWHRVFSYRWMKSHPVGQNYLADRDLVLICHHGIRSMHVATRLESKGFTRLFNLTGGLDQWSLQIDPNIPRY